MAYMAESVWSQLREGTKDIFKDGYRRGLERVKDIVKDGITKGDLSQWNHHRGKAYVFNKSDIGKPWTDFNVEQQASIVETWFSESDGRSSPKDARYPYITNNILAKSVSGSYAAVRNPQGYSPEIAEIQATLFALGYLTDRKFIDGFTGRFTKVAVVSFQKRNGLRPDGDLGTVNSATRRKLRQPIQTLVRAR